MASTGKKSILVDIKEAFKHLVADESLGREATQLSRHLKGLLGGCDLESKERLSKLTGELLHELAGEYGHNSPGFRPGFSAALTSLAADLGCFDAAFQRLEREFRVSPETPSEGSPLDEWLESAFRLGVAEWGLTRPNDQDVLAKLIKRLLRIIQWRVDSGEPRVGLQWLGELTQLAQQAEGLDLEDIRELGRTLTGKASIYVMDRIEPSNDKTVREIVKRFQPLVNTPTALGGIPDLHTLVTGLDAAFPWFTQVNKWIGRELSAGAQGYGIFHLRPLLLLGPPGIGKTSWACELATASGLPFVCLGVAGQSDNKFLEATARGWSTSNVCRPLEAIQQHGCANPVILLDEIDKPGTGHHNGHVWNTLLKLLEPTNAKRYYDECLQGNADLSYVSWICTANDISQLPSALLDRLEIFEVGYPDPEHYPGIVRRAMRDYQARHGLHNALMPRLSFEEWAWLRRFFGSPRMARKAVERLMMVLLNSPRPGQHIH